MTDLSELTALSRGVHDNQDGDLSERGLSGGQFRLTELAAAVGPRTEGFCEKN